MDKIQELAKIIKDSDNIVFFGGAGVSTASNIPDFRSSDGLYSKKLNAHFTPEQAVSHSFFIRHTDEFYDFYKKNLIYEEALPNDCHKALAKLEEMGKLKAVVTQNIDGLHQAAGSKIVYELHGSVKKNYCQRCHKFFDETYVTKAEGIPVCDECGGIVKPDVVLYEEGLDDGVIRGAVKAIADADVLIIGGTSLIVYPAAGFIHYFKGRKLVMINKSETSADKECDLVINDDIAMVMREALKLIESGEV